MQAFMRSLGGRKYFHCTLWLVVATLLRTFDKLESLQLVGLYMWFFSNVVIAATHETVTKTKVTETKTDAIN